MKIQFRYIATMICFLSLAPAANALCTAGQLTYSTGDISVSRMEGQKEIVNELGKGTEVHVIAMNSREIEIYVPTTKSGNYINSLGVVPRNGQPVLSCQ